ncbi:MAG: endonuclease domain-containing protein [Armatimonadetes bacterium]|nr:endonuclease domain-containing protein [Armatimonadota bacterium]
MHRARLLRRRQTSIEQLLWRHLRSRQLCDYKFRRQHPIDCYIVDFACERCRLVVELDGDSHFYREKQDANRTRVLEARGYKVVRFNNTDVLRNVEGVLEVILRECESRSPSP